MRLLRTLTLKFELFAGSCIRDVCNDLCELADRVGVLCEADFNGVKLWAKPGDNPLRLSESYQEQLKSTSTYKIAQAN